MRFIRSKEKKRKRKWIACRKERRKIKPERITIKSHTWSNYLLSKWIRSTWDGWNNWFQRIIIVVVVIVIAVCFSFFSRIILRYLLKQVLKIETIAPLVETIHNNVSHQKPHTKWRNQKAVTSVSAKYTDYLHTNSLLQYSFLNFNSRRKYLTVSTSTFIILLIRVWVCGKF